MSRESEQGQIISVSKVKELFTKMTVQNSNNLMFGVELLKVVSETPAGKLFFNRGVFSCQRKSNIKTEVARVSQIGLNISG